MARIFAIGDIHGCSNTFKRLLLDKIKIRKSDIIYCLGDYIDRGIDSKGVIDFILELRAEGYTIYTLRGNHEQMMLDAPISKEKTNIFCGFDHRVTAWWSYYWFLKTLTWETENMIWKTGWLIIPAV